jgi:hypothetical protein
MREIISIGLGGFGVRTNHSFLQGLLKEQKEEEANPGYYKEIFFEEY